MVEENSPTNNDVLVIGGGIVGVSIAHRLQQSGASVELLTRDAPGQGGSSDGNCGILAAGEIVPLSKPGVLKKVPGWLLDPKGPLFIRASQILPSLPWLVRFTLASRESSVRKIASALATLTQHCIADHEALKAEIGAKIRCVLKLRCLCIPVTPRVRATVSPGTCAVNWALIMMI